MEVEVVVGDALALVDEHAERHVEGLLAGAADPEVPVPLAVHRDEALLEDTRRHHVGVHLKEELGRDRGVVGADGTVGGGFCGGHAHGSSGAVLALLSPSRGAKR